MGELLHQVASEERLAAAWAEVRDNDLEDGEKSRHVAEFEQGALYRLIDLSRQLRTGTYEPSPVTAIEVPKPSGGTRLLAVPQVTDRIV
ncbi:hypothetical protein [Streptomyces sp. NPDC007856]|uniref:hypothetical protein n=1 Tax=Streptomyces sp. NPDC007856 TaxID=3364781 RepID=UPI0036773685